MENMRRAIQIFVVCLLILCGACAFAEGLFGSDIDLSVYPSEEWKSDYNDYVGDVVLKDVSAYFDSELKNEIGIIPAYTSVTLDATYTLLTGYAPQEFAVCCVVDYYEQPCFISSTALLGDITGQTFENVTVPMGTAVYKRPEAGSETEVLSKKTDVDIIKEYNGWILIREDESDYGLFGFIRKGDE